MMRLSAFVLLLLGNLCLAQAQVPMTGAGKGTPGGGAPAFTNWNPADLANMALSGSNLIATGSSSVNDGSVRAVASQTTGKRVFQCTYTTQGTNANGNSGCGIANATANLTTAPNSAANISAAYVISGNIFVNGSGVLASLGSIGVAHVVTVATDLTNGCIWYRLDSGLWNANASGDPTTSCGTGAISLSGFTGAKFPWVSSNADPTGSAWTGNFGATSYSPAAPAGYSNW